MDFDAAWCPVCEQQIAPKRMQVAIQPPPTTPAPPPSSPQSSPNSKANGNARRTKGLRTKGGLVQGTGRLRPNGTIKRSDSTSKQQQPIQPPVPLKFRTVIDQSPIPLYCSDECRMADLGSHHRGRPVNPNSDALSTDSEYDSPQSDHSDSSSSYAESSQSSTSKQDLSHIPPSILKLAEIYNFPSLPPPLPNFDDSSDSETTYTASRNEYTNGVMMAGKRIRDFCPKPAKKQTGFYPPPPEPKKHIPGWTDNTQGWRSSTYNLTSPKSTTTIDPTRTITPATFRVSRRSSNSTAETYSPAPASDEELLTKYSESFTRRADARISRSQASGSPSSARSSSSARRERSLVHPGAEGKLLVPDVKLKVNSASSSSLSSVWSGASSSRPSVRSPLSASSHCSDDDTDTQRCDSTASLPTHFKRPSVETRSWSYDNIKTYPLMPMPRKIIKRKEKRIIDGEEVEVEVEAPEPLKRLFLFPTPIPLS